MTPFQVHFCDTNEYVVDALVRVFMDVPAEEVTVSHDDITKHSADAVVSPANSFGFMDDGIDAHYVRLFGPEIVDRLQQLIIDAHDGELLVGNAQIVATNHQQIPIMISAPTMRVPVDISGTTNAYLAMRAVLLEVIKYNAGAGVSAFKPIRTVLCPGLGTAVGRMHPVRAALQMRAAWDVCRSRPLLVHCNGQMIFEHHAKMLRNTIPVSGSVRAAGDD